MSVNGHIRVNILRHIIFIAVTFAAMALHAQQAVMDLSAWDVGKAPVITLNGPWEMYWNRLLGPSAFKTPVAPDALVKPGSWSDVVIDGKPLTGKGFATYRLLLKNVPASPLMLDAYSVQTSCRVYANDSLVLETGRPGVSKETTRPMTRDVQVNLPGNVKDIQLTVQIANFHHRKGGFVHPFELGLAPAVTKSHMLRYMLEVIESSALFIIGLFLLALYIFRRKDLSVLHFSLFCITLGLRPVIAVNYLLATLFSGISWFLLLKLEYLAVLLPCLFMLLFIKKLFPAQMPSLIVKGLAAILLVKVGITVFFPPSVFSWLIPPLLIIIPLGVVIFAVTIVRAVAAKVEGSAYAGFGLIILLCSLILKVLVYTGAIAPIHALITGLDIGFIFMMSLILGARFSLQFAKVERLQQTTEIQSREIEHKNAALEEKNKSIIDSINYAQRIQASLLPTEKYIRKTLERLNGQ